MTTGGDFDYKAFRKDWDNLLERQKYKEAEKLCHEGLAKSPLDQSRGRLYNHLGYLYENFLDDKTFDDILEHYVLSLQVDESNANSHYNLANFLLEQGMQHLLRALELNPNHGKANKRYANLTPIKANTTLDFNGHKYQVVEVVEDGVRATKLRKRADGGYELSDEQPVYVEVSSPEKVHPSSGKKSQRTNNMSNGDNGRMGMEIEDNGYNGGGGKGNQKCCVKCVGFWWFWALLWILAIAGVVLPVLAYFGFLPDSRTEDCLSNTYEQITSPLITDTEIQGSLDALFIVDCQNGNLTAFNAQFDTINTLLSNMDDVTISYNIMQRCGQNSFAEGDETTFLSYTDNSPASASIFSLTQQSASDAAKPYLAPSLEACQMALNASTSTAPFLCVPFISEEFEDTFEAMDIAASTDFADIYLAFMFDSTDGNYMEGTFISMLGAFATGTECIDEQNANDATGNTWWTTPLIAQCDGEEENTCRHCLDVANAGCGGKTLGSIFGGEGVEQTTFELIGEGDDDEECYYKYDEFWFYFIGGVVPLLIWVLVTMFVLCCCSNRNGTRNNMDASINGDNKQTAFV